MSSAYEALRSTVGTRLPRSATYRGSNGTTYFVGHQASAPSIAAFFSGDDVRRSGQGRVRAGRVPGRLTAIAGAGGLSVLRPRRPDPRFADVLRHAIVVPELVDIHTDLPTDLDALHAQLRTSTTREDLRRIRRANFTYRVTRDPDAVREFHARHVMPLVAHQFPEDGRISPVEQMLDALDRGGELVCADIDGTWVAGIFNVVHEERYALLNLGIRDADQTVRNKRVASALIVRSLERAVELERKRATLGRSLPFLGKGPVWFKAKWGGIITGDAATREMHFLMDLRHDAVRRMLSESPVIHAEGGALVVSSWLDPGDVPLKVMTRDAGRFPGIARWYVLAQPDTLAAGAEQLSASERIVPVPVAPGSDRPLWLGELHRANA